MRARRLNRVAGFSSMLSTAALLFATSGCSVESKSESFSYDFTENSCPTGKQTFSDKASYCNGLLDENLNKGCAYSMRKASYEANCKDQPAKAEPVTPAPQPAPERKTSASVDIPQKSAVEKIEIDAWAPNGLSLNTDSKTKNDSTLTTTALTGELLVGRLPTSVRILSLSLASSVKVRRPLMAWCNLTEKHFGRVQDRAQFSMKLVGEESNFRADTSTSCLSTLTTASVDGLTIDFEDVPTVLTDGSHELSLVTLVIRANP